MKKIIPLFLFTSSLCFCTENAKEFWQQDQDFQKQHILAVEQAIRRIEYFFLDYEDGRIEPIVKLLIYQEMEIIKSNLGISGLR